jgi:hypothetical protein
VALVLSLLASIPQHELLQGIVYGVVLVTLLGEVSPSRTRSNRAHKLSGSISQMYAISPWTRPSSMVRKP